MFIVYYAALQLHNDYDRTTAHDGGTRHVYIPSPLRTCSQYVRLTTQAQIVRYAVEVKSLASDKGVRVWGRGWGRVRVM